MKGIFKIMVFALSISLFTLTTGCNDYLEDNLQHEVDGNGGGGTEDPELPEASTANGETII